MERTSTRAISTLFFCVGRAAAEVPYVPQAPEAARAGSGPLRRARRLMEAQRFEEALAEFDAAARTARDADARGCIELGRVLCLLQLGREDEAAMAVADGGDDASPRDLAVRLARVCALSGRTLDALQLLSALVQDDPAATGTLFDDPRLAALRDHPMFLQLLGRL